MASVSGVLFFDIVDKMFANIRLFLNQIVNYFDYFPLIFGAKYYTFDATMATYTLKPEYQAQVDLVQAKPFVLRRVWDWDSEKDTWQEAEIARSKTLAGIKSFVRLNKIPARTGEYRIEQDSVEFTDGWFPHFHSELIEEL